MRERSLVAFFVVLPAVISAAFIVTPLSSLACRTQAEVQTEDEWVATAYHTLGVLSEKLPLDYPVSLDLTYGGDDWGWLEWNEFCECYKLGINREASLETMIDTILEEYAHAIVYDLPGFVDPHGAFWGVAYAKCVRAVR